MRPPLPSTCFVGRILFREEFGDQPCPIPAENVLPVEPPMYFCSTHIGPVMDLLDEQLDRLGLMDFSIVHGSESDADGLEARYLQRDNGTAGA